MERRTNAGAVTWGNGNGGTVGVVSEDNSLVGSQAYDMVGATVITKLSNGNYLVNSLYWKNGGVASAGAVTWGNGSSGVTGIVTVTNSLVGSTTNDNVGSSFALSNGNYVVVSRGWDNAGVVDVGAVTWGDGTGGITGVVTVTNSLVGSQAGDQIGYDGVTPLSNGNYLVRSPYWANGLALNAGAITWGDGEGGTVGAISPDYSLVGSPGYEISGDIMVTELSNGNYVVSMPGWRNGNATNAGAVTWGDCSIGVTVAQSRIPTAWWEARQVTRLAFMVLLHLAMETTWYAAPNGTMEG